MLLLILATWGCQEASRQDQPPEIRFGADPCDECHMIINEARYAAAHVTKTGTIRRFDDIGCLIIYQDNHPETVTVNWFKDYNSGHWIRPENARFVIGENLVTPMGYGIVALEDKGQAERLAEKKIAQLYTFKSLKEVVNLKK
jgi:copper chaperone NosL